MGDNGRSELRYTPTTMGGIGTGARKQQPGSPRLPCAGRWFDSYHWLGRLGSGASAVAPTEHIPPKRKMPPHCVVAASGVKP